jgi:hypothetical protein
MLSGSRRRIEPNLDYDTKSGIEKRGVGSWIQDCGTGLKALHRCQRSNTVAKRLTVNSPVISLDNAKLLRNSTYSKLDTKEL